ncbi:HAD-superfamily hydrolase subfamily IA variant 3 [Penicillium canescens]|nr:HAD-superfamily hydrolase subfamily IA variant 3 [Penicillium canescens]
MNAFKSLRGGEFPGDRPVFGPSSELNETRDLEAQVEEPECRLVTIRPEVGHLCLQEKAIGEMTGNVAIEHYPRERTFECKKTSFPAIRACIFGMDGLLINSEDLIGVSINKLLEKYGRPALTRSIQAQMMDVADSSNGNLFHNWAKLHVLRGVGS